MPGGIAMDEDTKNMIRIHLDLLKGTLVENRVSMGFDRTNNSLIFFDTDTYIDVNKFSGFSVKLEDLVK